MWREAWQGRRVVWGAIGLGLGLVLGGCGWLVPKPAELFPDEITPGWKLSLEGALSAEDLPSGAAGGWGAVWAREEAWIWAELVTMADTGSAAALFAEVVGSLGTHEEERIGDQGVKLTHGLSGLILHVFRVGPSLALVGSLARSPESAPSPEAVRQAALVLASRLPYQGTAVASGAVVWPSRTSATAGGTDRGRGGTSGTRRSSRGNPHPAGLCLLPQRKRRHLPLPPAVAPGTCCPARRPRRRTLPRPPRPLPHWECGPPLRPAHLPHPRNRLPEAG